jgi:HKD family nuclease
VNALAELPGVKLRISLDGRRTRLHAKAWIFHRKTGFGTAFVGSANLSESALIG